MTYLTIIFLIVLGVGVVSLMAIGIIRILIRVVNKDDIPFRRKQKK